MRNLLRKGFTLLELLVVIVILGLLAGLVGPQIFSVVDDAYKTKATSDIRTFESALVMFKLNQGVFPTQEQGLQSLIEDPGNLNKPMSYPTRGFIDGNKDMLLDPWGNEYIYVYPGSNGNDYDIISLGADGQPGGEGENADINSSSL